MKALRQYVELRIPPYFKWSASEWAALRAASTADEAQPWTIQIQGFSFVVRRDSRPIFEGRIRPTLVGGARLECLWCEGDAAIFDRGTFASESDIADMFIAVVDQLIEHK